MQERGVTVDHATVNRWILKYAPQREAAFHRRKYPIERSRRMKDLHVKGEWRHLYRAVDTSGQTIDFLLTEQHDERGSR